MLFIVFLQVQWQIDSASDRNVVIVLSSQPLCNTCLTSRVVDTIVKNTLCYLARAILSEYILIYKHLYPEYTSNQTRVLDRFNVCILKH